MTVEVSPSDLCGRIEPHVRTAIVTGTAVPVPALQSQGDLRRLLDERDRCEAVRRGFDHLSDGEIEADLKARLGERACDLYRRIGEWAEFIEEMVEDLEIELARRGVRPWIVR